MAGEIRILDEPFISKTSLEGNECKFVTIQSTGDLAVSKAGELAYGVLFSAVKTENSVRTLGVANVKVGTIAVPIGSSVTPDANGLAKPAETGEQIIGIATQSGAAGDIISVSLRPAGASK